jgi:pimeloyl-ACP methyl ester carboxylesterase
MMQRLTVAFGVMLLLASVSATQDRNTFRVVTAGAAGEGRVVRIESKDGTPIAIECAGSGPTLVMVHGGIGDRTRWTPMIPLLKSHFTACAMDRRGHGASGDSSGYSLQKEAEDIAAVVDSQPGTVYLLGHSYGGVAALEATFLTRKISKLILYEPPVKDRTKGVVIDRIAKLIDDGDREQAVVTFLREVVKLSPDEIDAMRKRPAWRGMVAGIDAHPRQMRALAGYEFDAKRISTMRVPTLLIIGEDTHSPDMKDAMQSLEGLLPNATMLVLEGQQHNAMDSAREKLAELITTFILGRGDKD